MGWLADRRLLRQYRDGAISVNQMLTGLGLPTITRDDLPEPKSMVYYLPDRPRGKDFRAGDLWFDNTAPCNPPQVYNGTDWEPVEPLAPQPGVTFGPDGVTFHGVSVATGLTVDDNLTTKGTGNTVGDGSADYAWTPSPPTPFVDEPEETFYATVNESDEKVDPVDPCVHERVNDWRVIRCSCGWSAPGRDYTAFSEHMASLRMPLTDEEFLADEPKPLLTPADVEAIRESMAAAMAPVVEALANIRVNPPKPPAMDFEGLDERIGEVVAPLLAAFNRRSRPVPKPKP